MYNQLSKKRIEHIRRELLLEKRESAPLRIPIFREGRILWLLEPDSAIYKEVASKQQLHGGRFVFYSDITSESPSLTVDDFEIVPALFGFVPPQAPSIKAP